MTGVDALALAIVERRFVQLSNLLKRVVGGGQGDHQSALPGLDGLHAAVLHRTLALRATLPRAIASAPATTSHKVVAAGEAT